MGWWDVWNLKGRAGGLEVVFLKMGREGGRGRRWWRGVDVRGVEGAGVEVDGNGNGNGVGGGGKGEGERRSGEGEDVRGSEGRRGSRGSEEGNRGRGRLEVRGKEGEGSEMERKEDEEKRLDRKEDEMREEGLGDGKSVMSITSVDEVESMDVPLMLDRRSVVEG